MCVAMLWPFVLSAQNPTCAPTAKFTYLGASDPEPEEAESYSGSAPVLAQFEANPSGINGDDGVALYSAHYEWKIYETAVPSNVLAHRSGENMETLEFTFERSGSFTVELKATFIQGEDIISYPEEGEEPPRFTVSIAESILEMPNAFSPNGDDWNEVYRAKDTHQSIIKFRATIFNRWGQRLYSWDDVNGGWDGKVNGKVVKDGVYFVNVEALGADGREYHIRKDVNVLTRKVENNE